MTESKVIRAAGGRFVARACPDPNCGGYLQDEGDGWLRCDGLTHDRPYSELRECYHTVEGLQHDTAKDGDTSARHGN